MEVWKYKYGSRGNVRWRKVGNSNSLIGLSASLVR